MPTTTATLPTSKNFTADKSLIKLKMINSFYSEPFIGGVSSVEKNKIGRKSYRFKYNFSIVYISF